MILFLDTSALVKLFQAESGTPAVIQWVQTAQRVNLPDIARLELMSALQRRLRNQELSEADFHLLREGFRERWSSFSVQPLNRKVVDEAEQLLLDYGASFGLRTLDALHAAAFVLTAEEGWCFAAADQNLCRVVSDLGYAVLNPMAYGDGVP